MRHAIYVSALVAMAGCTAPAPDATGIYRDPSAIMGGILRFDAARFAGDWATVSCIGTCVGQQSFEVATDGTYLRRANGQTHDYVVTAPGVLRRQGGSDRLVIMWVDAGFSTAAIGDADGRWAAILDRSSKPGPDRIAAAAEILDFNGWDTGQLRKVPK